jgi:hypothetical protein
MIVNQFTKWLECFPIANQTVEVVFKVLVDNVFSRLGCPIELHTDQGKNMDGNLVRQLCDLLQIAKTSTTPYHPSLIPEVAERNILILVEEKNNNLIQSFYI